MGYLFHILKDVCCCCCYRYLNITGDVLLTTGRKPAKKKHNSYAKAFMLIMLTVSFNDLLMLIIVDIWVLFYPVISDRQALQFLHLIAVINSTHLH